MPAPTVRCVAHDREQRQLRRGVRHADRADPATGAGHARAPSPTTPACRPPRPRARTPRPPVSSRTAAMPSSPRSAIDVGGAERAAQRGPVLVPAHQHHPLGAEHLPRAEHGAQPDRAVADHRDGRALGHPGQHRAVQPGGHHVRQRQQRRQQRVVDAVRARPGTATSVPSACGTRTASPCPPSVPGAPKVPPLSQRALHAVLAGRAGVVRPGERARRRGRRAAPW